MLTRLVLPFSSIVYDLTRFSGRETNWSDGSAIRLIQQGRQRSNRTDHRVAVSDHYPPPIRGRTGFYDPLARGGEGFRTRLRGMDSFTYNAPSKSPTFSLVPVHLNRRVNVEDHVRFHL